jgi:hypothetical protein
MLYIVAAIAELWHCDIVTSTTRGQVKGGKSIFKPWCVEGFIYLLSKSNRNDKLQTNKKTIKEMYCNMKTARPWMLAHLKIIWQFHAHPVHQKVSRIFGPRYIRDDLFLGPNLVSFNRAVVPLLELSFLTKSQKLTSA